MSPVGALGLGVKFEPGPVVALPATVVKALARHQPTSVKLRLDGTGVRATTANVARLRGRR